MNHHSLLASTPHQSLDPYLLIFYIKRYSLHLLAANEIVYCSSNDDSSHLFGPGLDQKTLKRMEIRIKLEDI